jgi:pyruvate,orthophosphate dikinase
LVKVVFSTEDAEDLHAQGKKCILVRVETSPEDVGGMNAAEGILTARGGMTSHAAVVGTRKVCSSRH